MSGPGIPYVTYNREFRPRRGATPQTHQAYSFPSPMAGVNAQQQLAGGDPLTAVVLENLMPLSRGCVLRDGYTEWQTGLPDDAHTIMSYTGAAVGVVNRTFAACADDNIYDITLQNQPLPLAVSLALPAQVDPGNFSYINFANDFGSYLCAVSAGGGYVIWDGAAWTVATVGIGPGEIDGIDPKDLGYIWTWGNRIWFIERDSMNAWYLPVGQITGTVAKFPLGGLAPHGGKLYAGVNWTVDGGGGDSGSTTSMNDKIIFVTDQGDIIIYGGTDPDTAATFKIEGRWYVGRIPVGGRAVRRYGSDVMLVSERGLVFLSEILRGQGFFSQAETARNINPVLATQVTQSLGRQYWECEFLPHEQAIIVNYPTGDGEPDRQWLYMLNNKAFVTNRGMPMLTVGVSQGRTFFADYSGNIWWAFQGQSDGETAEARGRDIEGYVVTTFQPMGDSVRQKRALMCKSQYVAASAPGVNQMLVASFSTPNLVSPTFTLPDDALWDVAIWDASVWAGDQQGFTVWRGAQGVGYYVAMVLRVKGQPGTVLTNWGAVVENGGLLGL